MDIILNITFPISLTFGRQGGYHTINGRLQTPTRAPRQTFLAAHKYAFRRQSWRTASSVAHVGVDEFVIRRKCSLLTMLSSIFGAERRINEPLSALAVLTGPDKQGAKGNKTPATQNLLRRYN